MSEVPVKKDQKWLQKLKEESWEAELLISTVAIFGTLQLFKLIDWATISVINILPPSQYMVGYGIVFGGLLAVSILTAMFIAHFLLRAYWVGLVGLNSVFPDYSIEDSAYSAIYTRKMLTILPKLKKTIGDVDELSSVIFSSAFFMLIIYTNISLTICILLWFYNLLSDYVSQYILYLPLVFIIILYILIIFLGVFANIKKNKDNETIQTWYFKVSKWSSMIILGPLYKYLLQISMTFGSNFKKKKSLVGLTITIIIFGFILTMFQFKNSRIPYLVNHETAFDDTRTNSRFYANRNAERDFLVAPQIDQDIVESDIIRLFIPVFSYELNLLSDICGVEPEERKDRPKWYLNCYSSYHDVFLNGVDVKPMFLKYRLPETGQLGIITYVDLIGAKRGSNKIKVIKNMENSLEWELPFQWVGR